MGVGAWHACAGACICMYVGKYFNMCVGCICIHAGVAAWYAWACICMCVGMYICACAHVCASVVCVNARALACAYVGACAYLRILMCVNAIAGVTIAYVCNNLCNFQHEVVPAHEPVPGYVVQRCACMSAVNIGSPWTSGAH